MEKRRGRPCKGKQENTNNKQAIIDATIQLIKTKGADYITVRHVCDEAHIGTGTFYYYFKNKDQLLMHFLKDAEFARIQLEEPISNIAFRQAELYQHLINVYKNLGLDFMLNFYNVKNYSLSTYMSTVNDQFMTDTVMARSEEELKNAQTQGFLPENLDIHTIAIDICTIVKGAIFEWCLSQGHAPTKQGLERLLTRYINGTIQQYK